MKRYGDLYKNLISFENLLLAAYKAQKGKRSKGDVARFLFDLEKNILNSIQGWNAHAAFGNTFKLREKIFSAVEFRRDNQMFKITMREPAWTKN